MRPTISVPLPGFVQAGNAERTGRFRQVTVRCKTSVLRCPDGFCEAHVNTMEGFWSLLRSWLRPYRGISKDKLPLYLGFCQFVHNAHRRGNALLGPLVAGLVA